MIQIYPAELGDLDTCYRMDSSYTTDYVWQMQTIAQEHTLGVRFDTVRLPRSMRSQSARNPDELYEHWQQDGCFLVARNAADETVGFLDATSWPWQKVLWVSNLVVTQYYRRQGFGSRLLQAAVRWAVAHRLGQVMLEMQTKNYPAICFAQKNGFQFCGYNERYYLNGDIAVFFSRSV